MKALLKDESLKIKENISVYKDLDEELELEILFKSTEIAELLALRKNTGLRELLDNILMENFGDYEFIRRLIGGDNNILASMIDVGCDLEKDIKKSPK